ncbi:AAA family ATPase [Moorena producens JHB]|uniref:histidine kinase n=1 Tax=Moorena producens (strain JHB) TaxID=1454205 RepID=A0A1D9FWC3_MOOP1|nr:hybrid sensor histidine kinase/response regulator [Moorena producens]AOY79647.2 AAA family ATPase [Moorena producens JHB]
MHPPASLLKGYQITAQLYESLNSVVYRGYRDSDQQPVILKFLKQDYPSPEELTRYQQEYHITRSLNLEGVIQVYDLQQYQNTRVIILEDFGGESLSLLLTKQTLSIKDFITIAIKISEFLGEIHAANVIHKDINPSNIVFNCDTGELKIIDFGISTVLSRENPTLKNPHVIEGTLAYISPEQTGRMNRSLDYRTDFYSLGVTFYELLTKQLPFPTTDLMELVHSHLAKSPVAPHLLISSEREGGGESCPKAVSDIVLKLMAKNAEDRYQSAHGLKTDLEHCLEQLQTTGEIKTFQLGHYDISEQFTIPETLYGRDQEIATLLAAFDRIAALGKKDGAELLLVAGYSGVGKSALVNEVYKPITAKGGNFIAGKYDQYQHNIPYDAIAKAFRDLCNQLLTASETTLNQWRQKIRAAVGNNGQVLIDVIPDLERIIGKQPTVAPVDAIAAQNRFNLVFKNVIKAICQSDHPLVLFIDNWQWADSASLMLLKTIITDGELQHLLVVGAYRDHEVDEAHPLMTAVEEIKQEGGIVSQIHLDNLKPVDVNQLIADALDCSPQDSQPLTDLVYSKTHGNAFFTTEFIKSIYTENLLLFNHTQCQWQWDSELIQAKDITDNVVDFMASKISTLSETTQKILQVAACIGNSFDVLLLSVIYQQYPQQIIYGLFPAIQQGLIVSLNQGYQLINLHEDTDPSLVKFRFQHDRVQQAAYTLIEASQKTAFHLLIGRLLLKTKTSEALSESIFEIIDHLNLASEQVTSPEEFHEIARLNLIASQKAKVAAAYQLATNYANAGINHLSDLSADSWQTHYELTLALHNEAIEAAYLNGDLKAMARLAKVVLQQAKLLLDKVKAYQVQIQASIAQNQLLDALNTALTILKLLGVSLPETPTNTDIELGLTETIENLPAMGIQDLINMPEMTDPYKLATMGILSSVLNAAYMAIPDLLPLIVFAQVNLSINHGNSSFSAFAYGNYGLILCGIVGDIDSGYEFGKLAFSLLEKFNNRANTKAKTFEIVCLSIKHWKEHIRETLNPLIEAYQSGLETGDLEYASFAALDYCSHSYVLGKELKGLEQDIATYSQAIHQLNQTTVFHLNEIFHQAVLNLLGNAENPCYLIGKTYNEAQMLPIHQQANDISTMALLYANKLILCFLFGELVEAREIAAKLELYLEGIPGQVFVPLFYFYDSLLRLALYPSSTTLEKEECLARVATNQEKMKNWADYAPMNYLHKFHLVEAERHRILGQNLEAMDLYNCAIAEAKENGYLNEEALANELAAKFYLEWSKNKIAQVYMIEAYHRYTHWGALAKVQDLEQRYPQLLTQTASNIRFSVTNTTTSSTTATTLSNSLDLISILKASQTLAQEIKLDTLLTKMMAIVIENAGAERAYLLLQQNQQWAIAAEGIIDSNKVNILQFAPLDNFPATSLPKSIINYVIRTQTSIVCHRATEDNTFSTDPYIQIHQPQSILCSPIINQGQLIGLLYLENNAIIGAFTPDRLEVLNLLTSQAAISLENSLLYRQLEDYSHTLEQKVEERTAQLAESNQQLKAAKQKADAANEAKSDFLSNMSHELRTPLNGIMGYAQILKRDRDLGSKQIDGLTIIEQSGNHLLTLINDILDLSKIEARKMELYPRDLHLQSFIESVVGIIRMRANEKDILFQYNPDNNLPHGIKADEKRLRQVLLNLLGNAVKFTDTGQVTLKVNVISLDQPQKTTVQTTLLDAVAHGEGLCAEPASAPVLMQSLMGETPKTALHRCKPRGNPQDRAASLRFQVIDTGVGITPEQLEKIFQPFEQVGDTQRRAAGTGLGLTITKQLVELMGAKLQVTSEFGYGSTFWFDVTFPVVETYQPQQPQSLGQIVGYIGSRRKLLIAEDKAANRAVLQNMLEPLGFEIAYAENGQQEIELAQQLQPDLILTDLVMPVKTGFEAIAELRSLPQMQDIPIIVVSANVLDTDQQKSKLVGCQGFLSKPVDEQQLLELLGEYLQLEWIYEEDSQQTIAPARIEQPLVIPPPAEMEVLYELAMLGSMRKIRQRANYLEELDTKYIPFGKKLKDLAEGFQEQKILALVEKYLEMENS